jgi:hypothetical protein
MKKFTVKDFLAYNNPCFSCKGHVNFYFACLKKGTNPSNGPSSYISPIVSNKFVGVDLKKTYNHLLNVNIYHTSNKFIVNNFHEFESFYYDNHISMVLTCPKCQTTMSSENLQFDLKNGYVKPTEVKYECLSVRNNNKSITIITYLKNANPSSVITVEDIKNPGNPFILETPPLPFYKFKNKEKLIEKVSTYMLFS